MRATESVPAVQDVPGRHGARVVCEGDPRVLRRGGPVVPRHRVRLTVHRGPHDIPRIIGIRAPCDAVPCGDEPLLHIASGKQELIARQIVEADAEGAVGHQGGAVGAVHVRPPEMVSGGVPGVAGLDSPHQLPEVIANGTAELVQSISIARCGDMERMYGDACSVVVLERGRGGGGLACRLGLVVLVCSWRCLLAGGGNFMHAGALDYAMHNYAQLCTIMHNYAKLCTTMRAALQRRHTGIANKREPGIAIPHKQTTQ